MYKSNSYVNYQGDRLGRRRPAQTGRFAMSGHALKITDRPFQPLLPSHLAGLLLIPELNLKDLVFVFVFFPFLSNKQRDRRHYFLRTSWPAPDNWKDSQRLQSIRNVSAGGVCLHGTATQYRLQWFLSLHWNWFSGQVESNVSLQCSIGRLSFHNNSLRSLSKLALSLLSRLSH